MIVKNFWLQIVGLFLNDTDSIVSHNYLECLQNVAKEINFLRKLLIY